MYLTTGTSDQTVISVGFGAWFMTNVWKAFAACKVRNGLVSEQGLTDTEFRSHRYIWFDLCDLLLGLAMAAAASGFLIHAYPENLSDLIPYFVGAPPAVWLTELIGGFVLIKLTELVTERTNPFLLQQATRWHVLTEHAGSTRKTRFPIAFLLPTKRELLRAIAIPFWLLPASVIGAL